MRARRGLAPATGAGALTYENHGPKPRTPILGQRTLARRAAAPPHGRRGPCARLGGPLPAARPLPAEARAGGRGAGDFVAAPRLASSEVRAFGTQSIYIILYMCIPGGTAVFEASLGEHCRLRHIQPQGFRGCAFKPCRRNPRPPYQRRAPRRIRLEPVRNAPRAGLVGTYNFMSSDTRTTRLHRKRIAALLHRARHLLANAHAGIWNALAMRLGPRPP